MAYYSPFAPYPMYQQPQYQPQQQIQQQSGGINWVNSDADAANFLMAPNSAATLWRVDGKTVYLKQTDATGKPSMKIYDLVERGLAPAAAPQAPAGEYVTKEDFEALVARVDALGGKEE